MKDHIHIHIHAIKATIDEMFTELVPKIHEGKSVVEVVKFDNGKSVKNKHYTTQIISTKDKAKLKELADKIIESNADHQEDETGKSKILELEIDKAKEYQKFFSDYKYLDYKSKAESRKYFSMLQDWIEFLENEIKLMQNIVQNSAVDVTEINKAHLSRCFFEIINLLKGNTTDKTAIAKFLYFLTNGKEATGRKEYQTLLNSISADNKQPNKERTKIEIDTIKKYLITINLLKEK